MIGTELFKAQNILQGALRLVGFLISGREGVQIFPDKLVSRVAIPFQNAVAKLVGPGRHDPLDLPFEIRFSRISKLSHLAPEHEVDAHHRTFREEGRRRLQAPIEDLLEHLLECEAHLRVVMLAWSVDENRDKTPELVAPDEDARPWREIDFENFLGDARELVRRYLEKLVARESLKNVQQGSAGMTIGWEA